MVARIPGMLVLAVTMAAMDLGVTDADVIPVASFLGKPLTL